MDRENAELVASELRQAGFEVKVFNDFNIIKVRLKNRKVNIMEVEQILTQVFDGIKFELHSINGSVFIK